MQHELGTVNLKHARERLREEHYLRWMLNPQRLAPLAAMPAFADETGTTPLTEVLAGRAEEQFLAIWEHLGTVR
ncbi:MAG: hypothetical protein HY721_17160 [Planctomycetes bacterium]|nr:hypothetical protein [Planctomycetota bacterium]